MNLKQLKERRGSLVKEADLILRDATRENRKLKPDEELRFERAKSDIFETDASIAKEEQFIRREMGKSNQSNDMNIEGYSLVRAIRQASRGQLDGLELEASTEIARRSGKETAGGSFFVPNLVLAETRAMSVTGDAGIYGGEVVQTTKRGFIDALRIKLKVAQAGATIFDGLTSNISIPREKAASTASWKSEVEILDEKTQEIDDVPLTPKRVGGYTTLSNQLLGQSSIDIERFVRDDLLSAIATSLDAAAINGSGLNNEPTGILNTTGIGSAEAGVDGGALDWDLINALVTAVADANGDEGKLAFLTNAAVAGQLRSTPKVSGTDSRMILEGSSLLDLPFLSSNNVPRNLDKGTATGVCSAMIYGNFADVILASFFSGSEIIVDPFSLATTGQTRIVAQSYCDIGVRVPASFAAIQDILTA